MMPDSSESQRRSQPLDDGYWEALFQQEDSLVTPSPSEVEEEYWPTGGDTADGRSLWAGTSATDKPIADPWQTARTAMDNDETLQLTVTGYNKGGLLVHWNGLQGFVPASQLIDFPQFHYETERLRALKSWLHETLQVKIVELNPATNRLILSERATLVDAEEREQIFDQVCPGDKVTGQVTNLTDFGAFVDLGGVEGLIHISELSWSRVTHPSDIVSPNQELDILVLKVDRKQDRIALSLKRLKDNPWRNVEKRYQPGQIVEGVVNNIVNFGAFVLLEDELEGLIHISELAEGSFLHPRDVVHKGQKVQARVLHVDGEAKRLALSLRQNNRNNHQE